MREREHTVRERAKRESERKFCFDHNYSEIEEMVVQTIQDEDEEYNDRYINKILFYIKLSYQVF